MTPTRGSDVSAPWMDRTWLQEVLRNSEGDPSLLITDHTVKDSTSKGDHYLSEMHRIAVILQRSGAAGSELFLIAKQLPPGNEMQKQLSQSAAFPNEIKMFKHVLPRLHSLLKEVAPQKFQTFAARHIYSQDKLPYFLIVSDLAPEGFRLANRKQCLDLDHCLLVMKTLARYHATSISLHEREPELIESMKENMATEKSTSAFVENMTRNSINAVTKMVESWPGGGAKFSNMLSKLTDVHRFLKEEFEPKGNRLNVLVHGDLWVNNMLFKYNDVTEKVEDIRFVDFQMPCYTSCAIDLQYFMYTSPKDEVRESHIEDILKEYHNELCSTLKMMGLSNKVINFQELLEEYERKRIFGLFSALVVLPLVLADSEDAADLEGTLAGHDQSQSNDTRAMNKEYVKVMKRLLPFFEQKFYT